MQSFEQAFENNLYRATLNESLCAKQPTRRKSKSKFENVVKKVRVATKRKKKTVPQSVPEVLEEEHANKNGKTDSDTDFMGIVENEESEEVPPSHEDILDWPQEDLQELTKRIESAIPEKDGLAYSTRIEKLNWDDVAFNNYSGERCKTAWLFIQKKIRRFRLLMELVQDAKEMLTNSWSIFQQNKNKRHPDMPKRPLSSFMIFYKKKRDKILRHNPGIELPEVSRKVGLLFRNISPLRKEKYLNLAIEERKQYSQKLEEFYLNHPEIPRNSSGSSLKASEIAPKKPQTPFGLYFEEQLNVCFSEDGDDRALFKENCKEQWKQLSDKKRLKWIDSALENESKYQEELKKYIIQNPTFFPSSSKSLLNKEEKLLKDRLAGKPKKPPQSAYALFSQMMMQSEEIKKIDIKFRLKSIAEQWKKCDEDEKKRFKMHSEELLEQYKVDFTNYLETLPEDKRKLEMQANVGKRRKPTTEPSDQITAPIRKKKKIPETVTSVEEPPIQQQPMPQQPMPQQPENQDDTKVTLEPKKRGRKKVPKEPSQEEILKKRQSEFAKAFKAEPPTPPMSGFDLFSTRYHGKISVNAAWKRLNKEDKREYQLEVEAIKEAHIKEYEIFLKSLNKDQLTVYFHMKKIARAEQNAG